MTLINFIYCYKVSNSNILLKICQQNTRILTKLDTVISGHKALENRLSKLETKYSNNNNDNIHTDQDFIKVQIFYKIA